MFYREHNPIANINLLFALEKILTQTAKELIDVSVKCFVKLRLYTSAS